MRKKIVKVSPMGFGHVMLEFEDETKQRCKSKHASMRVSLRLSGCVLLFCLLSSHKGTTGGMPSRVRIGLNFQSLHECQPTYHRI